MKNNIIKTSLANALGVTAYAALVSLVFRYGEKLFGKMNNFWGPLAFLLLFVLSAAIVGALILGKPLMLYLDGVKKEAAALLFCTIGWLCLATIIALAIQVWI